MSLGRREGQGSGQGQGGQANDQEPESVDQPSPPIRGRPATKKAQATIQTYEGYVRSGPGPMVQEGGNDNHEDTSGNPNAKSIMHRDYDPTNFIVPGSDAQGHSERIQCRVPPGMLRQISAIVASKRFPFRTEGDVYRWSVWVGIQLLDRLEPAPNTFLCRIDAANSIIREQAYLQEYQATLIELERAVQGYMATGARGQAVKMIHQVLNQYGKIDEEYWRLRLVREVKERFGHILGGGQVNE